MAVCIKSIHPAVGFVWHRALVGPTPSSALGAWYLGSFGGAGAAAWSRGAGWRRVQTVAADAAGNLRVRASRNCPGHCLPPGAFGRSISLMSIGPCDHRAASPSSLADAQHGKCSGSGLRIGTGFYLSARCASLKGISGRRSCYAVEYVPVITMPASRCSRYGGG
jgi:hypothetical protein